MNRPPLARYAIPVLTVGALVAIRLALWPALGVSIPFVYAIAPVVVSAWYGGFGPGLLATLLSALFVDYVLLAPRGSLLIANVSELVAMVVFIASGALVGWLMETMHRAQARALALAQEVGRSEERLRKLNEELEQRVEERTRQLEQANERLKHRAAELDAANRELEAFSYSVSHDLRTPLRAIDGFSQAVVQGYADRLDARGQDYLQRVRRATQRLGHLIDDFQSLTKTIRTEMHRQPVDLSRMAEEVLAALREEQPERRVEAAITPGMVAEADPGLLRTALENLVGNAWKFTSLRGDARIEFGTFGKDGERVYYLRDNGAGFDPAYAGKLFTPFQRLHTEDEFAGSGLGLALVQRIVRRHGGRIWAEGAVDQGATFFFTLEARGQ